MANKPTVSVIIPVFNMANFIGETLKSLTHQSFKNFEVIIIDDGSEDNLKNELSKLKDLKLRIRYLKNPVNLGVAQSRNKGVKASQGEYITFLSADDIWLAQKLEKQLDFFYLRPKVKVVSIWGTRFDGESNKSSPKKFPPLLKRGNLVPHILKNNVVFSPLFKRELFCEFGLYDERLSILEDWEFHIRIAIHNVLFDYVNEILMKYRMHKKNLTNTLMKNNVELIKAISYIINKYQSFYLKFPKIYSKKLLELSLKYLLIDDYQNFYRLLNESLSINKNFKNLLCKLMAYFSPRMCKKLYLQYLKRKFKFN